MIGSIDQSRRPRVLLTAYACSPERGSEAGVGWHRVVEIARSCDALVICEESEFASEVRRHLATHGDVPGLHFHFVPQRPWESLLWRVPGLGYLAYNLWQRRAFRVAKRLHAQLHFDLVHQVNFGTYREPGYLYKLDVPFVWGPFGGTQNYPWRFLRKAGVSGAIGEGLRNVLNAIQLRWNRCIRRAAGRAAAVVAANSTTQRDFERIRGVASTVMADTGVTEVVASPRRCREPSEPLRILWMGHLITRKALHLVIEALARLPAELSYELRVVGDGPKKKSWQRLARRRRLDGRITWLGRLPHHEALRGYAKADVFVFSSLRDTNGAVVLEALSNGLPVVCLDHQGVHDVVTTDCGIKVSVTTPNEVIGGLAEALRSLAQDPERYERLSRGALDRARHYLWSRQGERMDAVYERVLGTAPLGKVNGHEHLPVWIAGVQGARPWTARLVEFRRHAALRATAPLDALLGSPSRQGFGILMYHSVAAPVRGVLLPAGNVAPARFRAQMSGLLARGYQPWPLRKALEWHRAGRPIPPKVFVVTFDDGYESVYSNAWPILRELDVPATVFLITSCLDGHLPSPVDDSWRALSTAQCAEMQQSGLVELGTHTHTHADFSNRPEEFGLDLCASTAILLQRFAIEHVPLAFPFGAHSPELIAEAKQAGVACCLTTAGQRILPGSDPYWWGRMNVEDNDTEARLAAKLDGWYHVARGTWRSLRELTLRRGTVRQ